jgi:hypothetical protein
MQLQASLTALVAMVWAVEATAVTEVVRDLVRARTLVGVGMALGRGVTQLTAPVMAAENRTRNALQREGMRFVHRCVHTSHIRQ